MVVATIPAALRARSLAHDTSLRIPILLPDLFAALERHEAEVAKTMHRS